MEQEKEIKDKIKHLVNVCWNGQPELWESAILGLTNQEKQKLLEEIEKIEKELNEIRGENKELDDAFPVIQKIFKRIYLLK